MVEELNVKNQTPKNVNDRRSILARTTGALALPMFMNGIPLHAFDGPALHDLFNVETETDRVLVLIQHNGGND